MSNPKVNDRQRYGAELQAVIKVLKKRYQNLSASEAVELASEILLAIDETIDL